MKLKKLNQTVLPKVATSKNKAKISFTKTGVIYFNPLACELLSIKKGDKISFAQEEDTPENWYVYLDAKDGYELREKKSDKPELLINHKVVCETVLQSVSKDITKTHSFLLAKEPTTFDDPKVFYHGIIIA